MKLADPEDITCDNIFFNPINHDKLENIRLLPRTNHEDCAKKCEDEPKCQSYYNAFEDECRLFSAGYGEMLKKSGLIGGPKKCDLRSIICVSLLDTILERKKRCVAG